MKKPIFGYVFLFFMIVAFAYSVICIETHATIEILPIVVGAASGSVFWIWMAINFFRNRENIKHPFMWGFFFIIAGCVTAIVYFLFRYSHVEKSGKKSILIGWLDKGSKSEYYFKLSIICLLITILHHYVMLTLYTLNGMLNNELYYFTVNAIYYPFTAILMKTYKFLSVDTTKNPSNNIIMVVSILNFVYTFFLFLISSSVLLYFMHRRKRNNLITSE